MRIVAIFLLSVMGLLAQAQETLRLAIGEWPPFHGEALPNYGTYTHLMVELLKAAGYQVEIAFYPWKRSYHLVEHGEAEITGLWSLRESRCETFYCTEPIVDLINVLMARKSDNIVLEDWPDLKPYTTGVTIGYTHHELRKAEQKYDLEIVEVRSDLLNLRKLLVGHIDLFSVNPEVGTYLIENHFTVREANQFEKLAKPLEYNRMCILISPKASNGAEIRDRVNQVLQQWRDTQVLDSYLQIKPSP